LKTLIGPDAPKYANVIEVELKAYPDIWARTENLVHLRGNRWDLYLGGGVKVRLPETNIGAALGRLAALQSRTQILDRELAAIDLRLPDRITLSPTSKGDRA
ncbi:MAG: cell division protein FtsQ/DivIB, partial [Litorimonas sp.]